MIVTITKLDWFLNDDPPEGTVTFRTKSGNEYEAFSYNEFFKIGSEIEANIGGIYYHLSDEVIFSQNINHELKLVKCTSNWEYEGYGQIKSIEPVIIDFGDIQLETGNWTKDEESIGKFVYWKIERLDW